LHEVNVNSTKLVILKNPCFIAAILITISINSYLDDNFKKVLILKEEFLCF